MEKSDVENASRLSIFFQIVLRNPKDFNSNKGEKRLVIQIHYFASFMYVWRSIEKSKDRKFMQQQQLTDESAAEEILVEEKS
jgi:hypothetical protein